MQITIYNTDSGTQDSHALDKEVMTIGRSVVIDRDGSSESTDGRGSPLQPDIALPSRLVSPKHIVLSKQNGQWILESKGLNQTWLNDNELPPGKPHSVIAGDRLSIGEFELAFFEDEAVAEMPVFKSDDALLMDVEREIHADLLDRMDFRRDPDLAELKTEKSRQLLAAELQKLIEAKVPRLEPDHLENLTRIAVYKRAGSVIISAGTPESSWQHAIKRDANAPFVRKVEELLSKILDETGAQLQADSLDEDFTRLDQNFQAVYQTHHLDYSRGFREFLIAALVEQDILDLVYGLGPLQDLLNITAISEIMVVARQQIYIEKAGIIEDSRRSFFSDESLHAVIEKIVSPLGRQINRSSPLVDARLADGSRVNAIIPPLALKGPCLTIRKFSKIPLNIRKLIGFGALNEQMNGFLKACVVAEKNVIVSGGTGSGKTTLLNCLSQHIPGKDRIVTIEDTAELQLQQSHVVTLESRPANMEGKGEISIQDLVKNALRMRPDRIIVGECRGAEALDMLQAMNTGHDGSMTTGHANSPEDMMLRIETMVLMGTDMPLSAIREQIRAALDIVVQLNRFADGSRRVTHIAEVTAIDPQSGRLVVEDIFSYRSAKAGSDRGQFRFSGYIPSFIDELLNADEAGLDVFF